MSKQVQYPNDRVDASGKLWPTVGENIRYGQNFIKDFIVDILTITFNVDGISYSSEMGIKYNITRAQIVSDGHSLIFKSVLSVNITGITYSFSNIYSNTGLRTNGKETYLNGSVIPDEATGTIVLEIFVR